MKVFVTIIRDAFLIEMHINMKKYGTILGFPTQIYLQMLCLIRMWYRNGLCIGIKLDWLENLY